MENMAKTAAIPLRAKHSCFGFGLLIVCLLSACGKKTALPYLSPEEEVRYSSIPKLAGPNNIGNKHAAMIFQSEHNLKTAVIDGYPASSFPQLQSVADQRDRQLDNSLLQLTNGKIINGKLVQSSSTMAGLLKFQVALVYTSFPDASDGQYCSGALIAPSWILTAAHCVRTVKSQDVKIYEGSYSLLSGGQMVSLAENGIIKNENYNGSESYPTNDIALLKLQSPITDIQPVPLITDSNASNFFTTNNVIISGWGETVQNSPKGSDQLLYAPVQTVPISVCKNSFGNLIIDGMMCANSNNSDSCQGDSGGPVTVFGKDQKLYETGIVSWGIGCAQPKYPGVYTDISVYAKWISDHEH